MKRLILFSAPTPEVMAKVIKLIFPAELENKRVAYMPSDGAVNKTEYTEFWQRQALDNGAERFEYINNSLTGEEVAAEIAKITASNILILTGGNTFTFLRNIKRNGMFDAIKDFASKEEFVIAGFSAGGIILTPNISICNIEGFDSNDVGLNNLTGLNLVDFEFFPHYSTEQAKALAEYQQTTRLEVRTCADTEFILRDID